MHPDIKVIQVLDGAMEICALPDEMQMKNGHLCKQFLVTCCQLKACLHKLDL